VDVYRMLNKWQFRVNHTGTELSHRKLNDAGIPITKWFDFTDQMYLTIMKKEFDTEIEEFKRVFFDLCSILDKSYYNELRKCYLEHVQKIYTIYHPENLHIFKQIYIRRVLAGNV